MTDEQVASWQAKLDRAFPRGLVAAWQDRRVTYLVPRAVVTGVSDGCPVVWLPVFAGPDKVLGPLTLTAYDRMMPQVAKIRFDGVDRFMTWYSGVSQAAARAMAPERQRLIRLAPQGGEAVLHEIAAA